MGVTKTVTEAGNGVDFPSKGALIDMHYTGYIYDATKPDGKGNKFDSSYDRKRALQSPIGVSRLIKGWDEGVPQMSLGEKAVLDITPDYGYGAGGYPPVIPPNSRLIFEVHLMAIGTKLAPGYTR